MDNDSETVSERDNPIRLRPAIVILAISWLASLVQSLCQSLGPVMVAAIVTMIGCQVAWLVWWLLASRVPWRDRLAGLLLLVVSLSLGATVFFHHSAFLGLPVPMVLLPTLFTCVTVGLLAGRHYAWQADRWLGVVGLLVGLTLWSNLRVEGSDGGLGVHLAWRWSTTAEQRFLAERGGHRSSELRDDSVPADNVELRLGDWPGFRGSQRDGRLEGVSFHTDWESHPPQEVWRKRIGPGWSSFAVVDGRLFTQEQRGDSECVTCYDALIGEELWVNEVEERFYRVESGAGPLATPTFHEGAIYTNGAGGAVQRLEAATGRVAWRRDLTEDLPRNSPPDWGFAASPLLVEAGERTLAIVYCGNPPAAFSDIQDQAVIAYNADSGEPIWTAGKGDHGYCAPILARLSGVSQVLSASNAGLESFDPATGDLLWFYEWSMGPFARITAPVVIDDYTLALPTGYGFGAHGIRVTKDEDKWSTETLWQSRNLKPYFNDCVFHGEHIYGFDGKFFTCLSVESGETTWPRRTRRKTQYGCGQVLLIEELGALLVVTELTGELVLLEANPEKPVELARLKVLEGKTWNHPVIAHGRLYVRNGEEMACYELPALKATSP